MWALSHEIAPLSNSNSTPQMSKKSDQVRLNPAMLAILGQAPGN